MKKEKMNDKGFSLVELIIVIAIMAVLVVVLAPQYLKYVERSRNSTDLQNGCPYQLLLVRYMQLIRRRLVHLLQILLLQLRLQIMRLQ